MFKHSTPQGNPVTVEGQYTNSKDNKYALQRKAHASEDQAAILHGAEEMVSGFTRGVTQALVWLFY